MAHENDDINERREPRAHRIETFFVWGMGITCAVIIWLFIFAPLISAAISQSNGG